MNNELENTKEVAKKSLYYSNQLNLLKYTLNS